MNKKVMDYYETITNDLKSEDIEELVGLLAIFVKSSGVVKVEQWKRLLNILGES
jgi:hypothetical protein